MTYHPLDPTGTDPFCMVVCVSFTTLAFDPDSTPPMYSTHEAASATLSVNENWNPIACVDELYPSTGRVGLTSGAV